MKKTTDHACQLVRGCDREPPARAATRSGASGRRDRRRRPCCGGSMQRAGRVADRSRGAAPHPNPTRPRPSMFTAGISPARPRPAMSAMTVAAAPLDGIRHFRPCRPAPPPTAPNQVVATEYYGAAFVLPLFRRRSDASGGTQEHPALRPHRCWYASPGTHPSGAEAVNLTCHSMGCEISRYLIENDVEHLASSGQAPALGVVRRGGKRRHPRRYRRRQSSSTRSPSSSVRSHRCRAMNRKWVTQYVASYDHLRVEGNNPLWGNLLCASYRGHRPAHRLGAGHPAHGRVRLRQVPNDGIVPDEEMCLQPGRRGQVDDPSGTLLPVGRATTWPTTSPSPSSLGRKRSPRRR